MEKLDLKLIDVMRIRSASKVCRRLRSESKTKNFKKMYEETVEYITLMKNIRNDIDPSYYSSVMTSTIDEYLVRNRDKNYLGRDRNNFMFLYSFCLDNVENIRKMMVVQNQIQLLSLQEDKKKEKEKYTELLHNMNSRIEQILDEIDLSDKIDFINSSLDVDLMNIEEFMKEAAGWNPIVYNNRMDKLKIIDYKLDSSRKRDYNQIRNFLFNNDNMDILENRNTFRLLTINPYKKLELMDFKYEKGTQSFCDFMGSELFYNSHFNLDEDKRVESHVANLNKLDIKGDKKGNELLASGKVEFFMLDYNEDVIDNKSVANSVSERRTTLAIGRKKITSNSFDIVYLPLLLTDLLSTTSYLSDIGKRETFYSNKINEASALARDGGTVIIETAEAILSIPKILKAISKMKDLVIIHHDELYDSAYAFEGGITIICKKSLDISAKEINENKSKILNMLSNEMSVQRTFDEDISYSMSKAMNEYTKTEKEINEEKTKDVFQIHLPDDDSEEIEIEEIKEIKKVSKTTSEKIMSKISFIKNDLENIESLYFKGEKINFAELENYLILNRNKTADFLMDAKRSLNKKSIDSIKPLLPFNEGQIGLMLSSGCVNGVVSKKGEKPHIIRGDSTEEKTLKPDFSEIELNNVVNNSGTTVNTVAVTERKDFCVNIECLTQDGVIKKL